MLPDCSLYGLIGFPLSHSFSPGYFAEKFRREEINAAYFAYPLRAIEEFPAMLKTNPGLRGLNVTIPYKTAVIPYLQELSPEAKAIGAVNCISFKEGKLTGHNTDWKAFLETLKPLLQPWHNQALVLGNGGAAKAVVYALKMLGIPFQTASRAGGYSLPYQKLTPELLEETFLVINTTPLGMFPDMNVAPAIPYEELTPKHLLYDLIYNPPVTKFIRLGAAQGAVTKNGLEMMQKQAEASWKIWGSLQ